MRGVFVLHAFSTRSVIRAYRAKFKEEATGEWACVVFYRPLSFLLTPMFAVLRVPPTLVTLVGLAVALALPFLAAYGGENAFVWVGLGAVVFQVLDCIDGDLARTTDRVSPVGAYADFLVDIVYRIACYTAVGMLVSMAGSFPAPAHFNATAIGMIAALLAVVARLCRLRGELNARATQHHAASAPARPKKSFVFVFLSGLDHLTPIALLALGSFGHLDWLLIWLIAYSLGDFLITQFTALRGLT